MTFPVGFYGLISYLWDGVTVITGESLVPCCLMHPNNIKIKTVLHTVYTTR